MRKKANMSMAELFSKMVWATFLFFILVLKKSEHQIRGDTEDNSKVIFLISQ